VSDSSPAAVTEKWLFKIIKIHRKTQKIKPGLIHKFMEMPDKQSGVFDKLDDGQSLKKCRWRGVGSSCQ
jgi:hypothetical protein